MLKLMYNKWICLNFRLLDELTRNLVKKTILNIIHTQYNLHPVFFSDADQNYEYYFF